jgi:hypothetical protein
MGILDTVIKTPTPSAPKGVLYGPPGVGKTTFAAGADNHIILDCENGAGAVGCQRTPYLDSWPKIEEFLSAIEREQHGYNVIAIDTIDWLIRRVEEHVSGCNQKETDKTLNRSHGGYGNGKQVLKNYLYRVVLPMLDHIVARGVAVILLAHARRTDWTDVDGIQIEKTAPDLSDDYLNVIVEWSDFVCLARCDDGNRTLITAETPTALAKNRYNLPPVIPFTWGDFSKAVSSGLTAKFKKGK